MHCGGRIHFLNESPTSSNRRNNGCEKAACPLLAWCKLYPFMRLWSQNTRWETADASHPIPCRFEGEIIWSEQLPRPPRQVIWQSSMGLHVPIHTLKRRHLEIWSIGFWSLVSVRSIVIYFLQDMRLEEDLVRVTLGTKRMLKYDCMNQMLKTALIYRHDSSLSVS